MVVKLCFEIYDLSVISRESGSWHRLQESVSLQFTVKKLYPKHSHLFQSDWRGTGSSKVQQNCRRKQMNSVLLNRESVALQFTFLPSRDYVFP